MKFDFTYRQWWLIDAAFVTVGAALATFIDPKFWLLPVGFVAADRTMARHFTGSWLGQPNQTGGYVEIERERDDDA